VVGHRVSLSSSLSSSSSPPPPPSSSSSSSFHLVMQFTKLAANGADVDVKLTNLVYIVTYSSISFYKLE